jgi:hypothetical protein
MFTSGIINLMSERWWPRRLVEAAGEGGDEDLVARGADSLVFDLGPTRSAVCPCDDPHGVDDRSARPGR